MAGNWKMHKTPQETVRYFEELKRLLAESNACEVVVFPPAIDISSAVQTVRGTPIQIGDQNLYCAQEGSYTGETSAGMLAAAGASWVLVGHSERRYQVAHEADADVLRKTQAALAAGLTPIVCMGERINTSLAKRTRCSCVSLRAALPD
jgi:triosephosphate isomerase